MRPAGSRWLRGGWSRPRHRRRFGSGLRNGRHHHRLPCRLGGLQLALSHLVPMFALHRTLPALRQQPSRVEACGPYVARRAPPPQRSMRAERFNNLGGACPGPRRLQATDARRKRGRGLRRFIHRHAYLEGSFRFVLRRLWHVDPAKRNQALVPRIELIVMLKDKLHQVIAINQAEVAFRLGEGLGLGREGA